MNETFRVREELTIRTTEALSRYPNANTAMMDIIDNAIDNRIEGKTLTVNIRLENERIIIQNFGGYGLDKQGVEEFYKWGQSSKKGKVGQYGVGGKAAMKYLGKSATIECAPNDSNTAYKFTLDDVPAELSGDTGVDREVEATPKRPERANDGYFFATIKNLNGKTLKRELLIKQIGETYKPLLEKPGLGQDAPVTIRVNGQEVKAAEINYVEEDANFQPLFGYVQTGFGKEIKLKIGIAAGDNTKP